MKSNQEKKAIELLYDQVFPQLKRFLIQNKGDEQQAEDLFHDALIKMIVKVRNNELDESTDAYGYLFSSARNAWYTKTKRDQKVKYADSFFDSDLKDDSTEFAYFNAEKSAMMDDILKSIGDTCRELLKLTFYKDYSLKEAAEIMGLSGAETAKTYQYRCKKKLVEKVKNNKAFLALMS